MKRNFRNDKGEFITSKDWFKMKSGKSIRVQQVTNDFNKVEVVLDGYVEFQAKHLGNVELAIFAASCVNVRIYMDELGVYVSSSGEVEVYMNYTQNNAQNRQEVFRDFLKLFLARIQEQKKYCTMAEAIEVEVPDK